MATSARRNVPRQKANPPTSKYKKADLLKKFETKSEAIRFLDSRGLDRTQIAEVLDIRYQHVRNVLLMPLTKKTG